MASFSVVHATAARGLPSLSRRAPLSAKHAQAQAAATPFARRSSTGSAVKLVVASRSFTRVGFAAASPALSSGVSKAARGAGVVPRATVIKAAGASDSDGSDNDESSTVKPVEPAGDERAKTLLLGALFAGWYATNIVFNIYNKQVLKVYPYPFTSTLCQFGVGAVFVLLMWASGRA